MTHTVRDYEFSPDRMEWAQKFAEEERKSCRPHEEVYVTGPFLQTAESVWPSSTYPQRYRDGFVPRIVVTVERFR